MKLVAIHDGHNASVAYLENGEIKFAIQEERLSRVKNAIGFPTRALEDLLIRTGNTPATIDEFIFTDIETTGGGLKVEQGTSRILRYHRQLFEQRPHSLSAGLHWLSRSILAWLPPVDKFLRQRAYRVRQTKRLTPLLALEVPREKISFMDHHTCHAAAAAYGWGNKAEPFVVVTSDGIGDGLSGSISLFENGFLTRLAVIPMADSIARLYALTTFYLGLVPLEHEYKLMGLAPYAEQSTGAKEIAAYFQTLFELNPNGLTYRRRLGVEPAHLMGRRLKRFFQYRRFDQIAAGLQLFTEEFTIAWIKQILTTLKIKRLALAGGLFMNVKLNKRLMELPEVDDLFVFPSCGDETNVFGALYLAYWQKTGQLPQPLKHFYWGGEFSNEEIKQTLDAYPFEHQISTEFSTDIEKTIADLLANHHIVARFSGRMEFGARSLGNRSILANPADWEVVKQINRMIKSRDFWMPFAPSLLSAGKYLINPKQLSAPYMIMAFETNPNKRQIMAAAIHPYDETARPQEVDEVANPEYTRLIREFEWLTGESVILNTSFNLHGYPLVYTPADALAVFDRSGLNYLAIGNYLLSKTTKP